MNNKDSTDNLKKNCLDSLKWGDCNAVYVGQTCRTLETWINELTNRVEVSQFGKHLEIRNHQLVK